MISEITKMQTKYERAKLALDVFLEFINIWFCPTSMVERIVSPGYEN